MSPVAFAEGLVTWDIGAWWTCLQGTRLYVDIGVGYMSQHFLIEICPQSFPKVLIPFK